MGFFLHPTEGTHSAPTDPGFPPPHTNMCTHILTYIVPTTVCTCKSTGTHMCCSCLYPGPCLQFIHIPHMETLLHIASVYLCMHSVCVHIHAQALHRQSSLSLGATHPSTSLQPLPSQSLIHIERKKGREEWKQQRCGEGETRRHKGWGDCSQSQGTGLAARNPEPHCPPCTVGSNHQV